MSGWISTLFPVGILLFAAGYAYSLTRSNAQDPKLALLDRLLHLASDEDADFHQRHAA